MQSSPSRPDPLDPGPAGFAHRGLHHGAGFPENSLLAFAAALELGAGIECDLRLTVDNQILVFHDADAWRMCASPLRIDASTHVQLGRLRVGEGPIPTLRSLLTLVAGRVPLLLEVKVDGDLWRWIPALRRDLKGYDGRYGVMSFDARLPRLLKTNLSAVRRGLVVRHARSPLKRWLALWLAAPEFLAVDKAALGEAWVARARKHRPVYAWAIDSAEQRRTASVHADALIWEADGRP